MKLDEVEDFLEIGLSSRNIVLFTQGSDFSYSARDAENSNKLPAFISAYA